MALDPEGDRVVAERGLRRGLDYRCPVCDERVILKAGSQVIAHFAHEVRGDCVAAEESRRHLAAKKLLADRLTELGLRVTLEAILSRSRRADLLVEDDHGTRFTIEIQDSPISPDDMKARERSDRGAGCVATCWIFTSNRVAASAWEHDPTGAAPEVRFPNEMRYRWNATHLPVIVLRLEERRLYGMRLAPIDRPGSEWYDSQASLQSSMDYRLRSTFAVDVQALSFTPQVVRGRYDRLHVTFEAGG